MTSTSSNGVNSPGNIALRGVVGCEREEGGCFANECGYHAGSDQPGSTRWADRHHYLRQTAEQEDRQKCSDRCVVGHLDVIARRGEDGEGENAETYRGDGLVLVRSPRVAPCDSQVGGHPR